MRLLRSMLAAALLFAAPPAALVFAEDETPEMLPAGKGRDETFYACIACHGTALIKAQGMSRERWDETLDWMMQRHNMPELDKDTRLLVLDYLSAQFPPRQRAFSQRAKNLGAGGVRPLTYPYVRPKIQSRRCPPASRPGG